MLKISFDTAFDQGYWPGPLEDKKAVAGQIFVGPLGLLNICETMTGLRGPSLPSAVRVAAIVPDILATEGFWNKSAEVDPFGTAAMIIKWRDYLWLHGWRGEGVSTRLSEIAQVTKNILPGLPDRLLKAKDSLCSVNNDISEITLFHSLDSLPRVWQKILRKLQEAGTNLITQDIVPAHSNGDLAASRNITFSPYGDGSLQLLRTSTPSAAAHETAAWLSGLNNLDQTVIIGPDTALDEALYRFGLPTTGSSIPVYDNTLLQILPLVLEMGWEPPDPQRALELLTLPVSPVPKNIAFRLAQALHDYPAVGSNKWNEAMQKGLQTIEEPKRRINVKTSLETIFNSCICKEKYFAKEILNRIDLIQTWAKGRMLNDAENLNWQPLIAQLENAKRLVNISELENFTAPQIKRMIHDITEESGSYALYAHQAGLPNIGAPECLVAPAKNIVWWSFNRESAQSLFIPPFSPEEKMALKDKDVFLPDPGKQAEENAYRWQRPLMLAHDRLILVCPQQNQNGEEQYPHPLWDELVGKLPKQSQTLHLERQEIISSSKPKLIQIPYAPLPSPETHWHVEQPDLLPKRDRESANSLSSLISCPFQWVVNYLGGLYSGLTASLSEPEELEGWFVHEIVSQVLEKGKQAPKTAAKDAGNIFDQQGPLLAAKFFLPGFDHIRSRVRNTVLSATEHIFQVIQDGDFDIQNVEESFEQKVRSLGFTLVGRPDLVLNNPLAVLDMKRGGLNYRKSEIKNGTSVQLAVYGQLLRKKEKHPFPSSGYFILKAGQIITSNPETFPHAMSIEGLPLVETWKGIKKSYKCIRRELDEGKIRAPGNEEEPLEDSTLIDGKLYLAPCAFCNLGVVCGQSMLEER